MEFARAATCEEHDRAHQTWPLPSSGADTTAADTEEHSERPHLGMIQVIAAIPWMTVGWPAKAIADFKPYKRLSQIEAFASPVEGTKRLAMRGRRP